MEFLIRRVSLSLQLLQRFQKQENFLITRSHPSFFYSLKKEGMTKNNQALGSRREGGGINFISEIKSPSFKARLLKFFERVFVCNFIKREREREKKESKKR